MPGDPADVFEVLLPRSEVQAHLLQAFERSVLPHHGEHGNLKRPPTVKSARQKALWWKGAYRSSCAPAAKRATVGPLPKRKPGRPPKLVQPTHGW
eukprot:966390-Amphidinium_carterae.1